MSYDPFGHFRSNVEAFERNPHRAPERLPKDLVRQYRSCFPKDKRSEFDLDETEVREKVAAYLEAEPPGARWEREYCWYRDLPIMAWMLFTLPFQFIFLTGKSFITGKEELPYYGDNHKGSPW